jgi:hypothetical protein
VLLQQLQTLATAVLDNPPSATSTSMKDKQSAMETAAQQVASASGVTAGNVGLIAAMQAQTSSPEVGGPAPSTQLRWLSFTDTSNYYIRAFEATAEQNTPDANGKRYFTEFRERVVGGQEQPWTRPQVYWTGSEWFACPPISCSRSPASPAARPNPCTARAWSAEPSKACAISPA